MIALAVAENTDQRAGAIARYYQVQRVRVLEGRDLGLPQVDSLGSKGQRTGVGIPESHSRGLNPEASDGPGVFDEYSAELPKVAWECEPHRVAGVMKNSFDAPELRTPVGTVASNDNLASQRWGEGGFARP